MPKLHEEWVCEAVEELGKTAKVVVQVGDGDTLVDQLDKLADLTKTWAEWTAADTVDARLVIEDAYEHRQKGAWLDD